MTRTIATACAPAPPAERLALGPYLLLLVLALLSWWDLSYRMGGQLASGPGAPLPRLHPALLATFLVAARVAANAVEASAYALWWRARGARLPFARFFVGLVALSLLDRCAVSLAALAGRQPALAPWLAPLAGPSLLRSEWPALSTGLGAVFGGLGLLVLARITMAARLQAAALGRRLRGPLLVTAAAWLVTRVALGWTMDLVRGMSPLR
jgi:hypothetical protein